MGAHIGALRMEELVVDSQHAAMGIHRGTQQMALLARMIGGEEMLAPVLDPLHRPPEAQCGNGGKHVFRIELAADAKTAADMAFLEMDGFRFAAKHPRKIVARAMRHFCGAIKLE